MPEVNFSLDTNVILGIVNPKDRLHEISTKLMKNNQKGKLFLCYSALRESQTVLRNKINEVMAEIIKFFPVIYKNQNLDSIDLQALIIDEFRKIKDNKPGLKNFVDLVYHEISIFLRDHDEEELPSFLSQLSLSLSMSVYKKLDETYRNPEILFLNRDHVGNIKKLLADIYFKDNNDERIFQELMTNLGKILPIEFFLDDREFANKCEKGYANIANDLELDNGAFSCKIITRL